MAEKDQPSSIYISLMNEIKIRLKYLEDSLDGKYGKNIQITRENCFLQLRFVCELIALGCLVAHENTVGAKRLRKRWQANEIISELNKLHPEFYPQPIDLRRDENKNFVAQILENDHLKKEEIGILYGRCGDVLHRGKLKNLLKNKNYTNNRDIFRDIFEWHQKIVKLMNVHYISHSDGSTGWVVKMTNDPTTGSPAILITKREYFVDSQSLTR
ncbi:hypothetical protein [Stappia indica]|uniref:hypothetical protein n=1 Tax=Stappia indica TaxID=538381 RepID=UPI001146E61E|nr:hypothetical protein [Stappia indica]